MQLNRLKPMTPVILLLLGGIAAAIAQKGPARPPMKINIAGFPDGGQIPEKYGCSAKPAGVTPALDWVNAPPNTATFTLIVHDTEAHPGKGALDVTHWIVWNIPGNVHELPEDVKAAETLPNGAVQGKSAGGANAYRPFCPPPPTTHHYVFELYALDQKLDLGPAASRDEVMKAMDGHILGSAAYVGTFHQ
jgi:Raf kinase inhibitor-like YbhB/YbcL family protein